MNRLIFKASKFQYQSPTISSMAILTIDIDKQSRIDIVGFEYPGLIRISFTKEIELDDNSVFLNDNIIIIRIFYLSNF